MPDRIKVTARQYRSIRLACHAVSHGAFRRAQLVRLHQSLGLPMLGRTETRLPFAPGLGTGMSTASLIAHARLAGFRGSPLDLARATIIAEGASDPLMFARPDRLIWASREGRILGAAPAPFRAHVLAGFFGPAQPTRAVDQDYEDISDLLAAWSTAGGLPEAAELASESARRHVFRRGLAADPTADLARSLGALGWATSHSGAARALLFAPGTRPITGSAALREAGLYGICQFTTGAR